MSRSPVEILRGSLRWLPAAALVAVAPKCIVCLAAYLGVGATLGVKFAGPEICGAPARTLEGAIAWFSMAGAAVGIFVLRRLSGSSITNEPVHSTGRCLAGACVPRETSPNSQSSRKQQNSAHKL
jgi:hypothetical protein